MASKKQIKLDTDVSMQATGCQFHKQRIAGEMRLLADDYSEASNCEARLLVYYTVSVKPFYMCWQHSKHGVAGTYLSPSIHHNPVTQCLQLTDESLAAAVCTMVRGQEYNVTDVCCCSKLQNALTISSC